jgi:F420-non-reducing hydrogenase small subunit
MAEKPKVAFYWCASCGGCEEAVVDLAEAILDVVAAVDIVFWPVALDFKRHDVAAMPDGSIFATFLNGAIRTSEQEEMAHLLRRKSKALVALGSCSHLGGIPGLANLFDREDIFKAVYLESPSTVNSEKVFPVTRYPHDGQSVDLPGFHTSVRALDQVVSVDYYIPGCPPTPKIFHAAVQTLLSGELPPKGTVLAPDHALCDECLRKDTKPEKLSITEFKRPQQILIDEQKCLLAQGLLCMGPATRAGCEAPCVAGNMPCTGCCGPTSRVHDQGAKFLSSVASLIGAKDEAEIDRILDAIPDPVGTLYRYSLPSSLLQRKRLKETSPQAPAVSSEVLHAGH